VRRGYGILKSVWSPGIVQAPVLIDFLSHLLDDAPFSTCVIPFAAVSCDLLTGREVICRTGPMLAAVAASSRIPGVVSPVKMKGKWLVDGGPTSMVPVDAALQLSRLPAVAVTVTGPSGDKNDDECDRCGAPCGDHRPHATDRIQSQECCGGTASSVGTYRWAEFQSIHRLVAEGERVAEKSLAGIRGL